MTVSDFVCWVLRVPISSRGFNIICRAIEHVIESGDATNLYEHLQEEFSKTYSGIEKNIRDAKMKSLELMSPDNYSKVFRCLEKNSIKTRDFVLYSARYYKEEFLNEDKDRRC